MVSEHDHNKAVITFAYDAKAASRVTATAFCALIHKPHYSTALRVLATGQQHQLLHVDHGRTSQSCWCYISLPQADTR